MKKLLLPLLAISLFITGCTHYYYVPLTQNVPLFREKNEALITGSYGAGDESTSIEIQGAYAVSGNIGIIADFMSARGGDVSSNEDWGKGTYFDAAIGYFKPVNKYGVFEIYGGLGTSSQHHNYVQYSSSGGITSGGTSYLTFIKPFTAILWIQVQAF